MADIYAKVSVSLPRDPRITSDNAELLFIRSLLLSKELLTDGVLTRRQVLSIVPTDTATDPDTLINDLVEAGLWRRVDGSNVVIAGWSSWNRSAADVEHRKEKRRRSAEKANHMRWHDEPVEGCSFCVVGSDLVSDSDSNTDQKRTVGDHPQSTETETETEKKNLSQSVEGKKAEPWRPIANAFFAAIYVDLANAGETFESALTRDEAGSLRRIARDLHQVGATPDDVHVRVNRARAAWSDPKMVTVNAVSKNWSQFAVDTPAEPSKPRLLRCPEHDAPIIHGVCQACKYSNVEAS